MAETPNLLIRDARPDEWTAIRDLTLAAYEQYAAAMPRRGWEAYRRDIVETISDAASLAARIVAESDGALLGSVLLYPRRVEGPAFDAPDSDPPNEAAPQVRLLAVLPAARGQGVGRALMLECLHRARRGGASAVELHTTDLMQAAIRLYEQMGFVRSPETDWPVAPNFVIKGYRHNLAGIE